MGLLIGLIFGLLTEGSAWIFVLLISVALGAFWGAAFGFVAHRMTKGERDFSSIKALEAERYAVLVSDTYLGEALRLAKNQL
jgi:hypothetical protein